VLVCDHPNAAAVCCHSAVLRGERRNSSDMFSIWKTVLMSLVCTCWVHAAPNGVLQRKRSLRFNLCRAFNSEEFICDKILGRFCTFCVNPDAPEGFKSICETWSSAHSAKAGGSCDTSSPGVVCAAHGAKYPPAASPRTVPHTFCTCLIDSRFGYVVRRNQLTMRAVIAEGYKCHNHITPPPPPPEPSHSSCAFANEHTCDADTGCTWCRSAAVGAGCFKVDQAKRLPPSIFDCTKK
jgi:hypothetical protein